MSLEAIQRVTASEQSSQAQKAEAAAAAKKMTADAQRSGEALLETARQEAEAENKAFLQQAQERAEQNTAKLLEQARAQAGAMCDAAQAKLDAAADIIVRRVVNR